MSNMILPAWTLTFIHVCTLVVFVIGLLCFLLKTSPLRQILGLKVMLQSVSLGIITTGWELHKLYLSQSLVITALVIEAILIGLALTLIIQMQKHQQAYQQLEQLTRKDDG